MRIVLLLISTMVTTVAFGQLRLKAVEKLNVKRTAVVDGKDIQQLNLSKLSADSFEELQRNGNILKSLNSGEVVIRVSADRLYTTSMTSPESPEMVVTKYDISMTGLNPSRSIHLPNSMAIGTFKSGGLAAFKKSEEGGDEVLFFSSDLNEHRRLSPLRNGYASVDFTSYEDRILAGFQSREETERSRVMMFDSKGSTLFDVPLATQNISAVLAGKGYAFVYSFAIEDIKHEITCWDDRGAKQWSKQIKHGVYNWFFLNNNDPKLCIASTEDIALFESSSGVEIDRVSLADLLSRSKISGSRPDNFIKVLEIMSLPNGHSSVILFGQPIGGDWYKNIAVMTFGESFDDHASFFYVGDSKSSPALIVSNNQILIIKDDEIQKLEY
jgi:hypothetical protein